MSPPLVKKIIAGVGVCVLAFLAYYGSYLPLAKSQAFIRTLRESANFRTLEDFESGFSAVLDIPAPIGHEELVRNTAGLVLQFVHTNLTATPEIIKAMVDYIERYFAPIVERGRGMSFSQDLYLLGNINETAYVKTRVPSYLEKAHRYYYTGLQMSGKRPQFLYGLFDVFRLAGDAAQARLVGDQILAQWPADERTRQALEQMFAGAAGEQ